MSEFRNKEVRDVSNEFAQGEELKRNLALAMESKENRQIIQSLQEIGRAIYRLTAYASEAEKHPFIVRINEPYKGNFQLELGSGTSGERIRLIKELSKRAHLTPKQQKIFGPEKESYVLEFPFSVWNPEYKSAFLRLFSNVIQNGDTLSVQII